MNTNWIRTLIFSIIILIFPNPVFPQNRNKEFPVRGFHLDCRAEVMTMAAIKSLAKNLSGKGINTLIMEYEATFPFQKHATLCNKYAYTPREIKEIVSYCSSLGIDVIPLQNCFGHCEYILKNERYYNLREDNKEVSQVCPLKLEEATNTFREIFQEVAALHPSNYFHIGADETYLLGHCKKCSEYTKRYGASRLFVNYVKAMCEIVKSMGKTPIIWADIILKYPEAINELPKDLVFVDWNYGWSPNHFGKLETLFNSGAEVWGATALRSAPDNQHLTQWEKHFTNLSTFLPFARSKGYKGIIETSWSTSGVYGFLYDDGWEILEMYPVRYVYPMSGFNILIEAYCEAANSSGPLDIKKYITDYGKERFDLSQSESELFANYFSIHQGSVRKGKDDKQTPINEVWKRCVDFKTQFETSHPKKNKQEFEHYNLMLDIRIHYLAFKDIEAFYQSGEYSNNDAVQIANKLSILLKEAKTLGKRFSKLNRGYLKKNQIDEINRWRRIKMEELFRAVTLQSQFTTD